MGTTLYNKIHLGRASGIGLRSRRGQAVLAAGLCGAALLAWLLLRAR